MKTIAFLLSDGGKGSNLQALIDAVDNKKLHLQIGVVVNDSAPQRTD